MMPLTMAKEGEENIIKKIELDIPVLTGLLGIDTDQINLI